LKNDGSNSSRPKNRKRSSPGEHGSTPLKEVAMTVPEPPQKPCLVAQFNKMPSARPTRPWRKPLRASAVRKAPSSFADLKVGSGE
jgi:hypothetical protein